jgi:glycosyltransferase involved in cell wall biosynthesis
VRLRFYSYFYPPCIGGGEVILQHQAEGLVKLGHEVHVHTTAFTNLDVRAPGAVGRTGSSIEGGVHVHRHASAVIPFHNPMEQDAITLAQYAEAWLPADLLICVGFPSLHLHALSARARVLGTPLVVQNYVTGPFLREILAGEGGWNKRVRSLYWRTLVRRQLAAARAVIADSDSAAGALRESLGLGNVHAHIGMAVDPAEFDGAPAIEAVRDRLGLRGRRVILAPSRVSRQKGADLLVEAALPVLSDPWTLVICGPVNDATFASQVRARVSGRGDVVFAELPRPDFVSLFRLAEVVVLPSRGETVGGVLLEGMYSGALAIGSDAIESARDDFVRHEHTGLLFPSEDVDALRATLVRAMTEDLSAVRAAGKQMVEERFTWDASVARFARILEAARA